MGRLREPLYRHAREQAEIHGATFDAVLNIRRDRAAVAARHAAYRAIMSETGCNPNELAQEWGIEPSAVYRALGSAFTPAGKKEGVSKGGLRYRLRWHHGEKRAAQILSGRDPATQADIAKWNMLGRRSAA